jgi:hypothetical protein
MKSKGQNAWLVTWEEPGREFERLSDLKVSKIAAILPSVYGRNMVEMIVKALFASQWSGKLCDKASFGLEKNQLLLISRQNLPDEVAWGQRRFLWARKVQNVRMETDEREQRQTLYWTEPAKMGMDATTGTLFETTPARERWHSEHHSS